MIFRLPSIAAPIVAKIYAGVAAAAIAAVIVLLLLLEHRDNQLAAAELARRDQVAEYRRVYDETFRRHFAAAQAENHRLLTLKTEADDATLPKRSSALERAADYATRHSCLRPAGADSGAAGASRLPGSAAAAGGAAQTAAGSDLVAISRADLDACTLNTVDLGIAAEWARQLSGGD